MELSWQLRDARLQKRITDFVDRGITFVVGITADPESRIQALEEGGEDYDEMLVLYQTRSKSEVRRIKNDVASYFDGYADGHGRNVTSGPPFYVYLCCYAEA